MTIRVAIVDDQTIIRSGLRMMLETSGDFEVVAEAVDGADALSQARTHRPDVALVDLRRPNVNGIAATRRLLELLAPPQVLVLSTYNATSRSSTPERRRPRVPAEGPQSRGVVLGPARGHVRRPGIRPGGAAEPGPPGCATDAGAGTRHQREDRGAQRGRAKGPCPGPDGQHQRADRQTTPALQGQRQEWLARPVRWTRATSPRGHRQPQPIGSGGVRLRPTMPPATLAPRPRQRHRHAAIPPTVAAVAHQGRAPWSGGVTRQGLYDTVRCCEHPLLIDEGASAFMAPVLELQ
ncbi:response regulator [Streptomyces sp. x-19]|uniref:response regulator n=1 Tax=Streptomyces sp. x-19 TaxID=2789280 RepID=UPI00398030F4